MNKLFSLTSLLFLNSSLFASTYFCQDKANEKSYMTITIESSQASLSLVDANSSERFSVEKMKAEEKVSYNTIFHGTSDSIYPPRFVSLIVPTFKVNDLSNSFQSSVVQNIKIESDEWVTVANSYSCDIIKLESNKL